MVKKILGLFIFVSLLISFISSAFSFEANLTLDKEEVDINDYITLKIDINTSTGGEIGITNIKGIDNFDIINQSQSQSSSNSIVIIDGKTQSETKTSLNLNLILRAKNKGEYNIGPATLKRNKEELETNIVKIIVSGDKLYLNNNHLNISNNTQKSIKKDKSTIKINDEEKIEKYENIELKRFNNNSLYLFILVISFLILVYYFFIRNKQRGLNATIKNREIKKKIKDNKYADFEEKPTKIIYPQLTDSDFIIKISEILKSKLGKKYKINGVLNKTFLEILDNIGRKKDDKIEVLIKIINKSKYSNYIGDNSVILEEVKKI